MTAPTAGPGSGSATPAAAPTDVDPATGLRRRPAVPPEVLAMVASAFSQTVSPPAANPPEEVAPYLAWRFSGRWWSRPLTTRRARPYPSRTG